MNCFLCENVGPLTLTKCCNRRVHPVCNGLIRKHLKSCPCCYSPVEIPLSKHVLTAPEEYALKLFREFLFHKLDINYDVRDHDSLKDICSAIDDIAKKRRMGNIPSDDSDEIDCEDEINQIAVSEASLLDGSLKLFEKWEPGIGQKASYEAMTKEELIAKIIRMKRKQHLAGLTNSYLGTIVLL